MVIGHIGVELSLHHPLDQPWDGRNDGKGSKVRGVCRVSGFVDRMYYSVSRGRDIDWKQDRCLESEGRRDQ